jgi:hypothetical protein
MVGRRTGAATAAATAPAARPAQAELAGARLATARQAEPDRLYSTAGD